jgi:hypothetical protein
MAVLACRNTVSSSLLLAETPTVLDVRRMSTYHFGAEVDPGGDYQFVITEYTEDNHLIELLDVELSYYESGKREILRQEPTYQDNSAVYSFVGPSEGWIYISISSGFSEQGHDLGSVIIELRKVTP